MLKKLEIELNQGRSAFFQAIEIKFNKIYIYSVFLLQPYFFKFEDEN